MNIDLSKIGSILNALSPILVVILGAVLGAVGWLYKHEKERRQAAERQLSEHKYGAYITLLEIFFDIMKSISAGRRIDQQELIDRMFDANKELILFGSDDVVKAYQTWIRTSREATKNLAQFGHIIISIRKDMGNRRTKITSEGVLRQLILNYDDAKAKGLL